MDKKLRGVPEKGLGLKERGGKGIGWYMTSMITKKTVSSGLNHIMMDQYQTLKVIDHGLTYGIVEAYRQEKDLKKEVISNVMGVSTRTLQRFDSEFVLKPVQTEKFLGLAEVFEHGMTVFNSTEKLKSWLNTENFALGSLKPIDMIKNSYGKDMVLTELNNINHGILV